MLDFESSMCPSVGAIPFLVLQRRVNSMSEVKKEEEKLWKIPIICKGQEPILMEVPALVALWGALFLDPQGL